MKLNAHYFDLGKLFLKRFFLIVVLFSLSRFIFYCVNLRFFLPFDLVKTLKSFFFGIRFDLSVLYYLNFPFILFSLLPFRINKRKSYQRILFIYFLIVNSLLLLLNFIDAGYFQYSNRRSGWGLLNMIFTGTDALFLLPHYLIAYWYLFLLWIGSVYLLYKLYPIKGSSDGEKTKKDLFFQILTGLLILFIGFGMARGLKGKPLRMISANEYVVPGQVPLLLNTPFVIVNTIHQQKVTPKQYYSPEKCAAIYSPVHHCRDHHKKPVRKNVVIIILESFGKEYVKAVAKDGKSFTPFLDSLSKVGLSCTHAYANAFRSMDALPAIIGGFPSMLNTPFLSSAYSVNKIRGLPEILKEEGYQTAFFHGGHNGTMGFDIFSRSAGIDNYYGFNEYENNADYDGSWGIWDDKFLQFMAHKIAHFRKPFFAAVFTLSSHDPYKLPKRFINKFHPGENRILRTVEFTDYSLRKFFETASQSKWFYNTLFIITPDHTSKTFGPPYNSSLGRVSIPLIFYAPGDSTLHGKYNMVAQQLDIMPTVLDYLGYAKTYIAYGKSIFANGYRFSVSNEMNNYQAIDSSFCLLFDGENILKVFKIEDKNDPLNSLKQVSDSSCKHLEEITKAYLQDYFQRIATNTMTDTASIASHNDLVYRHIIPRKKF